MAVFIMCPNTNESVHVRKKEKMKTRGDEKTKRRENRR